MNNQYMKELDAPYTPLLVVKEASRCLLCHDAPCSKGCPAHTQPADFIRSVYFRNFKGAAEIIRENNALGGICARICPTEKLCQKHCTRGEIDTPIDIGKIQQFVTDFECSADMHILPSGDKKAGSVAIIGSGPAGLQASASLRKLGYNVDVYEKEAELGGWLRHGIPEFRLPNHVVDREISLIKATGVNFIPRTEVGKDITLEQLKAKYNAVLLACGASHGSSLALFKDNPHVSIAVEFLAEAKSRQGQVDVPASVLIVGGGDVAMDVATTFKKLGCNQVSCVAREELFEFPASQHELTTARQMNISIFDGFTPVEVNGNTVTFEHVRQQSSLTLHADKIILAIGQHAKLDDVTRVDSDRGIIATHDYQTSDPHVFAAGDIVKGDKTVVYAVKTGKEAALSINRFVQGE